MSLNTWIKPDGREIKLNDNKETVGEALRLGWTCADFPIEDIEISDKELIAESIEGYRKKAQIIDTIEQLYGDKLDENLKLAELKIEALKIHEAKYNDSDS